MKNMSWSIALVSLMAVGVVHPPLPAQTPQFTLTLKGVGLGAEGAGIGVQVLENYVYVAWSGEIQIHPNHPGGLEIFGVADPATPARVGGYESRAQANGIHVVGHYAYLAVGTMRTFTNDAGALEIIDVSDPANPVRVGGIDTPGRGLAVQVIGNHAYVAEGIRWTGSNLLGALEIFDVSTPTNPIRVTTYDTGGAASAVEISGRYAYLADGVTDLQVIDVSDPARPRRVGSYSPDASHNFCGFAPGPPASYVQVVGNVAYSAGENGLNVLDISDPANPVRLGGDNCLGPVYGLDVADHYAYLPRYVPTDGGRFFLIILDVSDPANPVRVGRDEVFGYRSLQIVGHFLYLAAWNLLVYEISDVPTIKVVSRSGQMLVLTWTDAPGFILQRASSLDDPLWSDVPGSEGQSRIELQMTSGNEFFRLLKPEQNQLGKE